MEIKLEKINEQPAVLIHAVTPQTELPMLMQKSMGELAQYLQENKQQPAGAPFIAYFNLDPAGLEVEIGFPVAAELAGNGHIQYKNIPAGNAVTCTHKGSYAKLSETYTNMSAFIEKEKLNAKYIAYEYYLNSLGEVGEDELLTKVVLYVD